jgi:hypothetical protein
MKGKIIALNVYRRILKAHKRHLPYEMKVLGDTYVKSEFKLFKNVADQGQLDQFYTAWHRYLDQLLQTARTNDAVAAGSLDQAPSNDVTLFGRHLPKDIELSVEQQNQLKKLREQATRPYDRK